MRALAGNGPSWKPAGKLWPCCTRDGFEGVKSFCLHQPAALCCCGIPAVKSKSDYGKAAAGHGHGFAQALRHWHLTRWYPSFPPWAQIWPWRLGPWPPGGKSWLHATIDGENPVGHMENAAGEPNAQVCQPAACSDQSALHPQARSEGSPAPNGELLAQDRHTTYTAPESGG